MARNPCRVAVAVPAIAEHWERRDRRFADNSRAPIILN